MSRIEPNRAPRPAASSKAPAGAEPLAVRPAVSCEAAAPPQPDRFVAERASVALPKLDPHSTLARIREKRGAGRAEACSAPEAAEVSREQRLGWARQALLRSFRDDFVPSFEFQDLFRASWEEVREQVEADSRVFGNDPDFQDDVLPDGTVTFIGRILGLYTEVTVNPDGSVDRPYFEID